VITIKLGKWGLEIQKRTGAKSISVDIGWNTPMFSSKYLITLTEEEYGSDTLGHEGFNTVLYGKMVWHSRF
jgi:hypothetical protein